MRSGKIVASRANSFGGFHLEVAADMQFSIGDTLYFVDPPEKLALSELIACAIELKQGNKEFALFWYTDEGYQHESGQWSAQIGNTCERAGLGEADAEFYAHGETPDAAVQALIDVLREETAAP